MELYHPAKRMINFVTIPKNEKEKVEELLAELGLNMTTAINLFCGLPSENTAYPLIFSLMYLMKPLL